VNGVTFTGTGTGGVSDLGGGNVTVANPDNGTNANFSNQGGSLGSLLDSAFWAFNGAGQGTTTISLNNLTAGSTYEVQVFSSDTRGSRNSDVEIYTGTADEYVSTVGNGSAGSGGGDGVVLTGSFVPTGSSVSFTYNYDGLSGNANYNAIQLRLIQSVPEPGTAVILGLGGLGLLIRRRR
jgi:hypothetical protein